MAEFVQLRKEKWTEPLAALLRLELLEDSKEIYSILENLDNFEYKIQTPNRKLEHVLAYIQYECDLLKRIQRRRKELQKFDLTDEIDRFIFTEIKSQFGSAEINFKHRIDYWNARLKFIATIVPEPDREGEFNLIFKKALNDCGRSNFEIYKYVVDFLWSFLQIPEAKWGRKRKIQLQRRDCSRLIASIREVTREALRNFPKFVEAYVWVILTEMKYLSVLNEEKHWRDHNPKEHIPYNIEEETERTEKIMEVFYSHFVSKHGKESLTAYFKLYDGVLAYGNPQASKLAERIFKEISSIEPRTPEIHEWLISKSLQENKINEFLERVEQALSSIPKLRILDICVVKLNEILRKLKPTSLHLLQLIEFSANFFSNSKWELIGSAKFHANRIQFVKKIPYYSKCLSNSPSGRTLDTLLQSMLEKFPVEEITREAAKLFPSNYIIVRERVVQILAKEDFKSLLVARYLSGIDWKNVISTGETRKFINFVYCSYLTSSKNIKNVKDVLSLNLSKSAGIDELRVLHLRKNYLQGLKQGRECYKEYHLRTSDWRFAVAAVEIETNCCSTNGGYSKTLRTALEDAVRLAGTTAAEPWMMGILSHYKMKNEKEAFNLMQSALSRFSAEKSDLYTSLLMFSKKLKAY